MEKADIKFHSDFNQLRWAVCNYGSVDAAGHTMEAYPMSESLCNSLSGLSLIDQAAACGRTQIEFPPFDSDTSLSEWLAQRDTGTVCYNKFSFISHFVYQNVHIIYVKCRFLKT